MTSAAEAVALPTPTRGPATLRHAIATLARRRFALTARTPRELVVPLVTPVLFALVIAPALKEALHTSADYESYVAIGTVGLLIPLNSLFLGIGSIVDRISGARRELLAAPIPRSSWRAMTRRPKRCRPSARPTASTNPCRSNTWSG